jgi:hypothetical protein
LVGLFMPVTIDDIISGLQAWVRTVIAEALEAKGL